MFKQFKEIKARDETQREESTLEKLITIGNELVNDPELKELRRLDILTRDYMGDKLKTINIEYNEKDIVDLIRSSNYDDDSTKNYFGIYAGCLLTKLTEARHAEGKTTNIVIDGVKQDYILAGTKKADYITINNCEGESIGESIGYEGSVKQVIITNCEGDYMGIHIGCGGSVEQVILSNCKGFSIGYNISSNNGSVKQVIINNCKGDNIGECIGYHEGDVNQIIINNCEGNEIGYKIGYWNGKVNQKIINDPEEIKRQGLTGLIELVDSLTGKSAQEVQEIAKKIGEYSNV